MNGWDVLNNALTGFPLVVSVIFLLCAVTALIIFIVGFSKYGMDFLRHGFKQGHTDALGTKIENLGEKVDGLRSELETLKVNHFGHLKNYLTVLDGILLDKHIVDNESKARLDNELRGM
jgi:hypothetical protein